MLFFVLVGTVLAIFQGLRSRGRSRCSRGRADQIARGDLEARVEVTSGDEIGMLGENFNYMADQLSILLQQTAEKATLEKELEVARTIQETLVPPRRSGGARTLKFAGYFQPASQCGGDWWTCARACAGGKILVVIGDVTGHGVPSAMITAAAKAACDVARAHRRRQVTVTRAARDHEPRDLRERASASSSMTCFASIIDPQGATITYANAGHNFPYLFRPGDGRRQRVRSLMIARQPPRRSRGVEVRREDAAARRPATCSSGTRTASSSARTSAARSTARSGSARRSAEPRRSTPARCAKRSSAPPVQFFGERPRKDDITMVFARIAS